MKKTAVIVFITLLFFPAQQAMAEWELSWTMPDDDRVTGVNIYFSQNENDINNKYDAGFTTELEMSKLNLEEGLYYFNATSYDADGNESVRSNTISFDNYVLDNGWTRVDSGDILGEDQSADYDGDGVSNQNDPDIDGDGLDNQAEITLYGDDWDADTDLDGTINVFDPDADGDGTQDGEDSHPLTNPAKEYVDHLYTIEDSDPVFVGLNTLEVSDVPVCICINRDNGAQRNIQYANDDYQTVSMENRGNLDGANGDEIAVTLENENTSETMVEIRDIITGELYDPAYCDIDIVQHQYFTDNGTQKLAILGFCEATQRTLVRIIDVDTRTVLQDINFLESGEHPLNMGIYDDIDGDGSPDIAVAPIPSTEPIEIVNIDTNNQITFD